MFESPEVAAKLSVNLSQYVSVDPVVVFVDRFVCDELRDHGSAAVNFILDSNIELLLPYVVWHYDQEEVNVLLALLL